MQERAAQGAGPVKDVSGRLACVVRGAEHKSREVTLQLYKTPVGLDWEYCVRFGTSRHRKGVGLGSGLERVQKGFTRTLPGLERVESPDRLGSFSPGDTHTERWRNSSGARQHRWKRVAQIMLGLVQLSFGIPWYFVVRDVYGPDAATPFWTGIWYLISGGLSTEIKDLSNSFKVKVVLGGQYHQFLCGRYGGHRLLPLLLPSQVESLGLPAGRPGRLRAPPANVHHG
ncbi:uncharacterized protein [Mobula birostris]|uniref:uncharacterized protein n=1 Tax=Mobula birostris TaxID=1983395 RepID=UPI003B28C1D0